MFFFPAKIDLYKLKRKWGVTNVYRAIALVCDWLNRDENVQVNGFICVVDNTDVTWSQAMAVWNHDSEKKIVHYFQVLLIIVRFAKSARLHVWKV